jgi:NAD-specific glutamate dehydrogenase
MPTKVEMVTEIGDVLTQIDAILSAPNFFPSDPSWQQLFALRKHLDDQQRELVQEIIQDDTASFNAIAAQLSQAADSLAKVGKDITKIGKILDTVSLVASLMDKVLNFVA